MYVVDGLYYLFILGVDFLCVINIILIFFGINIMYILDDNGFLNVCIISINVGLGRLLKFIMVF